jgi:transcription antitermination factor NusG
VSDLQWYCLWLGEPKAEMAAEDAIKALGFESFTPIEWKLALRNPKGSRNKLKVRKAYPLLLRYALVGIPSGRSWQDLLAPDHEAPPTVARNIIRGTRIPAMPIGMHASRPTRLTSEQIDLLASLSRYSIPYASAVNVHRAHLVPNIGSNARIIDGALFGHVGRVDKVSATKARLVIQILGSMRPVEVPLEQLEAA